MSRATEVKYGVTKRDIRAYAVQQKLTPRAVKKLFKRLRQRGRRGDQAHAPDTAR